MPIAQRLEAKLRRSMHSEGLDDMADQVVQAATECYSLEFDKIDDYREVGQTRLGGDPDLPDGVPWPCTGDPDDPESCFGNFLAQINFEDLPPLPSGSPLPERGIFYLFAQEIGAAADPVMLDGLYYDGDASDLRRTEHPAPDRAWNEDYTELHPVKVRAVPFVSVPWYDKAFLSVFGTGDDRLDRRSSLHGALFREHVVGQLLGFANAAQGENLYRQVLLGRIGKRELMFRDHWDTVEEYEACIERYRQRGEMGLVENYESKRPEVTWLTDRREMIAKGAAEWRLLLQIESNKQMNFWVNDADPLYAFIRDEDLRQKNFSDLAGEVTQG